LLDLHTDGCGLYPLDRNDDTREVAIVIPSVTFATGQVKLTRSSRDGKTLLVKIARSGDVLGLRAALLRLPYKVTARAIERTEIATFEQKDCLHFIRHHVEGSLHAAVGLSNEYRSALTDACRLALSGTIAGRVASSAGTAR
jgi:CRP/FNR family cyclic AMP-dependent transcriptional regulator